MSELAKKQRERGYSDGKVGHSPSLLRGPYMEGYVAGRQGMPIEHGIAIWREACASETAMNSLRMKYAGARKRIEKLEDENKRLRALEEALRMLIEDEDYDAGGLAHHQSCNTYHAWGKRPHACDCYCRDVMAALEKTKQ